VEVLVKELLSELRVEWSAVRDKSACLGDISDKSLLKRFEFVGVLDPSNLVISKGVNKSVSLVHLLFGPHSVLLKNILLANGIVILLLESVLKSLYFSEFTFSNSQLLLSLRKLSLFYLEQKKLWLHNL